MSVFEKYIPKAYPYRFAGQLHVSRLMAGIPLNPKVAEGWLRSRLGIDNDVLIQREVGGLMAETGVTLEEATRLVDANRHMNGFKRDPERGEELYIEGRQLKAAIKEAASVARAVGKLPDRWGLTKKGIVNFVAEHICVVEERLYLGVTDVAPEDVIQSFPKNPKTQQTGIQYTESAPDVKVDFTICTDYVFSDEEWAMLWLTGEQQGIGATRSQGYGRYDVTRWDRL